MIMSDSPNKWCIGEKGLSRSRLMQWKPIKELDFKEFEPDEIMLCILNGEPIKFIVDPQEETAANYETRVARYLPLSNLINAGITHFMKLEQPEGEQL
jgi:hypothetical protein